MMTLIILLTIRINAIKEGINKMIERNHKREREREMAFGSLMEIV